MEPIAAKPIRKLGRPLSFDKQRALECAMQAFWHNGYEATSISDLTHAMGITPPSLYAAFGDKERLFIAALEHYVTLAGETRTQIFAAEGTAEQAIMRLLELTAAEAAREQGPKGCLLVTAATSGSNSSATVQKRLAERRADNRAAIELRLRRGVEEGDLAGDTDVVGLAHFLVTVVHGMSIQAMKSCMPWPSTQCVPGQRHRSSGRGR
jgi:AcrR family transcriptional regulator